MVTDLLMRGWENFVARTEGPMNFRFILQPAMATLMAFRAGVKDAEAGRPAFFWSLLSKPEWRHLFLREGLRDMRNVLILAVVLDFIYQVMVQRGVYFLELLFTALTLALVPYLLLRGPINRITTWTKSCTT